MSKRRALLLILIVVTALGITAGVGAARGPGALSTAPLTQSAVGTSFTYQGSLEQGGSPANGSFDFEFRLFDALADGAQVGNTVALNEVAVVDGLFTVELDFGPDVFNGQELWLEASVRTFGDVGEFTVLSPRQPITPTPYAIFAANAWSMGGNSGTSPDADFLGTTDDQPLIIKTNDTEKVRVTSEGNVGIGTNDPQATLDVDGDIAIDGTTVISAGGLWVGDTAGLDGLNCWDLNENGEPDLDTEDINEDGVVDVLDCTGPEGPEGPDGPAGVAGPVGPVGPKGPAGPAGLGFKLKPGGGLFLDEEVMFIDPITGDSVTIGPFGIEIRDGFGNLIAVFDQFGSLHIAPEEFAEITVPLIDEFEQEAGSVVIGRDGIIVFDADGNVVSLVDAEGSIHLKPETFANIVVPLLDDQGNEIGNIELGPDGFIVFDANGDPVSLVDADGSIHLKPESFANIVVPLLDDQGNDIGSIELGPDGFIVFDAGGNPISIVNADGSVHALPEEFGEIRVGLSADGTNESGSIVINQDGITVLDVDGEIISRVNETGSLHEKPEEFAFIFVPLLDDDGNEVGFIEIGEDGLFVTDLDGVIISGFDENGSVHRKKETFNEIEIPLTDFIFGSPLGTLTLGSDGLIITDTEGNLISALTAVGSIHEQPEEFSEILVPQFDIDGNPDGTVEITEFGIIVKDETGEIVSWVNSDFSQHEVPETFKEIRIPIVEDGADVGVIIFDQDGMRVEMFDEPFPPTFRLTSELVEHNLPVTFNGPVDFSSFLVPLLGVGGSPSGEIGVNQDGLIVRDVAGNTVSQLNADGLTTNLNLTELSIPLTDADGNPSGSVVIDENGIRILDTDGNVISRVDEDGSLHKKSETFEGGISVPLRDSNGNSTGSILINESGITIFDAAGEITSHVGSSGSSHNENETFSGGFTVPLTDSNGNSTGSVVINENGISVLDTEGNVISNVDENGSTHNKSERFEGGLFIPLRDSNGNSTGTILINESGITIFNAAGDITSQVSSSGSSHEENETFSGGFTVPLTDSNGNSTGSVVINEDGISVLDTEGNVISNVDEDGSVHKKPEEFESITVPLVDSISGEPAGQVVINSEGISVINSLGNTVFDFGTLNGLRISDPDGNISTIINDRFSLHIAPERFKEINVFQVDSEGNQTGLITIDETDGLTFRDADGNIVGQIDETGSTHKLKETFDTIVVPLTDEDGNSLGQIQLNNEGLSILDADNNFISSFNETGSWHTGPEQFAQIEVPLTDGDGNPSGSVVINEDGITVLDTDGNVISRLDEDGSTHDNLESFPGGIFVPMLDGLDNPGGWVSIDERGIIIYDASGVPTSMVNAEGSDHTMPEQFAHIEIPLFDSNGNSTGTIVINGDGITLEDTSGNVTVLADANGLVGSGAASGVNVPLTDEFGDPSGSVVINEDGITVLDTNGEVLSLIDENGSLHKEPETFEGGITVPLIDMFTGADIGSVVINQDGISIFDGSGNLISLVSSEGSLHKEIEEFAEISVPLTDLVGNVLGEISIGSRGIQIFDAAGNLISLVDATGSTHNKKETFVELVVPLTDEAGNSLGQIQLNNEGLSILDADNNFISSFNEFGSWHTGPEEFDEIIVPLTDGEGNVLGEIVINGDGMLIYDADANLVSLVNENGSFHEAPEQFSEITVPLADGLGNDLGEIIIDRSGMSVYDVDGNLISFINEQGSEHRGPEQFDEIIVPLVDGQGNDLGEIVINDQGLQVFDADGNLVSSMNESGSSHEMIETFGEINVPLVDGQGNSLGEIVINEDGLQIFDADGNLVSSMNESGSSHEMIETFGEINVPLADGQGNSLGEIIIDENGIQIFDADGILVSSMDESGSSHEMTESFGEIVVELTDANGNFSGQVTINEDGIVVTDVNGETVLTADETGFTGTTSEVLTELTIAMESSAGVPEGEVIIDADGIKVLDANGDLVSRFDEGGSLHTAPEVFTGSLSANVANIDGTPTLAGISIDGTGIDFTDLEGFGVASISMSEGGALDFGVQGQRAMRFENLDGISPNIIGGHAGNAVLDFAIGATIAGGGSGSNTIYDDFGFIGGGDNNQAGFNDNDPTTQPYAVVGGGLGNIASGDRSVIAGGFINQATEMFASVGGGELNFATAETARVGGGDNNSATNVEATIAGGGGNLASGNGSTISGGLNNTASGFESAIGGGEENTATTDYTTVGGGTFNDAAANFATVSGGQNNAATGLNATIGGGSGNAATSNATVGGGVENGANSIATTIGGGESNLASGIYATIGGGRSNVASAAYGTIAGGGRLNPGDPLTANRVTDDYGVVSGGADNQAGDGTAQPRGFNTVGGGKSNLASGIQATVGGGSLNEATNSNDTVGGGLQNIASGINSTVAGGWQNVASGQSSTVPGGQGNSAAANFSFAAGTKARVNVAHTGAILLSDSSTPSFDSAASNEFAVRATGGTRIVSAVDANGATTAGVSLAPGSGAWAQLSDRDAKANFSVVGKLGVLELLDDISVETWNYKAQDSSIRHMGPVSQEFYEAFQLGADDGRITTVDASGVNLAAIQGLYQLSKQKDARIQTLETEVESLEARLTRLEQGSEDGGLFGNMFSLRSPLTATVLIAGMLVGAVIFGRRWFVRG